MRVDGRELRCRVVGEGGNLGLSQLGRIEYAQGGGRLNTDFVDNSGGVDCSDHEVNIKILLNVAQRRRRLTLAGAQPAAGRHDRGRRARSCCATTTCRARRSACSRRRRADRLGEHAHLIRSLELAGLLDRALEFLPTAEEIEDRRHAGEGLTRPELAMLLALREDRAVHPAHRVRRAGGPLPRARARALFPGPSHATLFASLLRQHRLQREIIATATTNSIVNRMGPTFVARTQQDTGADAATVARAYSDRARGLRHARAVAGDRALDNKIAATVQYEMMYDTVALLRLHATG